jgi:hypothetical protein
LSITVGFSFRGDVGGPNPGRLLTKKPGGTLDVPAANELFHSIEVCPNPKRQAGRF